MKIPKRLIYGLMLVALILYDILVSYLLIILTVGLATGSE